MPTRSALRPGVSNVAADQMSVAVRITRFGPNRRDRSPPASCVQMYPQKNAARAVPCDCSFM